MNTIGLQIFTLRDYISDAEQTAKTLRAVREMGYDAVQIWPSDGMTHAELAELVFSQGLRFAGAIVSLADILGKPSAVEKIAAMSRTSDLIIDSIPDALRKNEEGYRHFADLLTKAAAHCKASGLVMHYHPHAFEFCNFGDVTGMDILYDHTPGAQLHFMLDTHWVQAGGKNPADWIRHCAGRISIAHFKDYGIDVGGSVLEFTPRVFAPVGGGNLDWPGIVAACREVGVHTCVVEQDECKAPPMQCVRQSVRYLRDELKVGG